MSNDQWYEDEMEAYEEWCKAKQAYEDSRPAPIAAGYSVVDPDSTCGYEWAVYSRAEVEAFYGEDYTAEEITGWRYYNTGFGQPFGNAPYMRVSRTRILVKQRTGLDI